MLTPFDVSNLNRSLEGVGTAFQENRREAEVGRRTDIEEDFRKQMLAAEMRRTQAEEARAAAESQKNDLRDKQEVLKTIFQLNAGGQIKNIEDVNKYLATDPHWSAVGMQLKEPPQKPTPQAGQNAVAKAIQDTEMWRTKAEQARANGDDDLAGQYEDYASKLDKWTNKQITPTADTETVTEETPAVPGSPGSPATPGGLFGIGAKPAVPPMPAIPKRTVKRTIPADNTPLTAPAAPTNATPAIKLVRDPRTGKLVPAP